MKCAELMIQDPRMCVPEDNVSVAATLMWDHDCGDAIVVKDMESKQLVGMVTDRDIAMCLAKHANANPSEVSVSVCMASYPIFCNVEDPIETAIQRMGEHKIRRIPVVDKNISCVGIISQADLILRAPNMEPVVAMLKQISTPNPKEETPAESSKKEEPCAESAPKEEVPAESTGKEESSAEPVSKEKSPDKPSAKKSKADKNE